MKIDQRSTRNDLLRLSGPDEVIKGLPRVFNLVDGGATIGSSQRE